MICSEAIDQLAVALHQAQVHLPAIHKTADNPFFKSRYAPLGDVMEAALKACLAHGITILQGIEEGSASPAGFIMQTTLLHTSGQWMTTALWFPCPADVRKDGSIGGPTPQGVGAAVTYARRYALSCMLGIVADDDDDGETTAGRPREPQVTTAIKPSYPPIQRINVPTPPVAPSKGPGSVDSIPLSCPVCGGRVFDNRAKKASGEFKPTAQDWSCATRTCKTMRGGKEYRTGGWLPEPPDAPKAPVHAGPGAPDQSFDELPDALRDQDEDLPF